MIDFILIVFGYGGLVYLVAKKVAATESPNIVMVVGIFLIGSFCYYLLLEGLTADDWGRRIADSSRLIFLTPICSPLLYLSIIATLIPIAS